MFLEKKIPKRTEWEESPPEAIRRDKVHSYTPLASARPTVSRRYRQKVQYHPVPFS